ncbi:MAG: GlsB/YeaQ/YmgE family stress response membrane protein [Caldilineaceae bacterium]|nr:GlsB/YeaQ/YmgE family stress response membrane protein [Caldilineaceae bacterium]
MDVIARIITWLVVGGLAGSLAGMFFVRQRRGFGPLGNLAVGLVGALLGGLIFYAFNIDLGLGAIAVTLEDLVAALLGSLLFLIILYFSRKQLARR